MALSKLPWAFGASPDFGVRFSELLHGKRPRVCQLGRNIISARNEPPSNAEVESSDVVPPPDLVATECDRRRTKRCRLFALAQPGGCCGRNASRLHVWEIPIH